MPVKRTGRPLKWPDAWKEFALKMGGAKGLTEGMGYSSQNTLPDKVHGRSPRTNGDKKLIAFLCQTVNFDYLRLFPE